MYQRLARKKSYIDLYRKESLTIPYRYRFSPFTVWSISSEVVMDFELNS